MHHHDATPEHERLRRPTSPVCDRRRRRGTATAVAAALALGVLTTGQVMLARRLPPGAEQAASDATVRQEMAGRLDRLRPRRPSRSREDGRHAAGRPQDSLHVVAPGESLSDIAAAWGLPSEDGWRRLYDANPQVGDPDRLTAGMQVRIPHPDEALEPRPLPSGGVTSASAEDRPGSAAVWDRLAACESDGRWSLDTGNGYYGGLQFTLASWRAVGGTGYPHEASRDTQIRMAERLLALEGWRAWPVCSRRLGLR